MGGPSANIERLLELDPDVMLTSASGIPELDVANWKKLACHVVINGILEQTPLGRAEWGIFIAAFFDFRAGSRRSSVRCARAAL